MRYFLENNVVLDGEGEEVEFSVNDFDWTLSLDLKVAESLLVSLFPLDP